MNVTVQVISLIFLPVPDCVECKELIRLLKLTPKMVKAGFGESSTKMLFKKYNACFMSSVARYLHTHCFVIVWWACVWVEWLSICFEF